MPIASIAPLGWEELVLEAECPYLPSCREVAFSETRASSIKYSRERHGPGPMGKTFGEHNMAANYYPKISFMTLQIECPPYRTGAELTIRPTAAKRSSRKLGFGCMEFSEAQKARGQKGQAEQKYA
jgi:hypothetical protein